MISGEPVDCLPLMPITMMFASDRIGKPYREYASDHRVLAEAQVHVANEFDFDYVSVISDPAREASDCGAAIEWFDDQPPAIDESRAVLADASALASLTIPDPAASVRMRDRIDGVALLKQMAGSEKLVEGWIEGPCAEAADLRGINTLMCDFFERPDFVRELFAFAVELETRFAREQIEAGADIIGIGDAAASLVGPQVYDEFVWPYEKQLVDAVHDMGGRVRLHICGDTRSILKGMGELHCEIVDLDYMVPLAAARDAMGPGQVLLGNLDPVSCLRNGTPVSVTKAIAQCHEEAGSRYIVGAGCEVVRDTPDANIRALCDYARNH
jgi:MtaA/CmuA family methyltransferase